jgi:hypothetical protein
MTPKEKAMDIFNKMMHDIMYNCQPTLSEMLAKQCALIAVDEILSVIDGLFTEPYLDSLDEKEYWQQVKTEIENL